MARFPLLDRITSYLSYTNSYFSTTSVYDALCYLGRCVLKCRIRNHTSGQHWSF
jgi:hypothetical protein